MSYLTSTTGAADPADEALGAPSGAPAGAPWPPSPAIRLPVVAVYAERAMARAGLAAMLRSEMIDVVLPNEEGLEPVGVRADVILLASFGPERELAATMSRRHGAPALIMVDRPLSEGSLEELGVQGAICRECPPERLIEGIHAVAAGGTFFRCHTHASSFSPGKALLSPRERRVAAELARGAGIEEIAAALYISPHTARTHVRNIRRKLGARTSAEAVARALTLGLVEPSAR